MKDVLLITPPFTQLNTPYPATAYLKGFLNTKGFSSFQMDLGIEVILELFSANGLLDIFKFADETDTIKSENATRIFSQKKHYTQTIDAVISFLQGSNPSLARNITSGQFLPQASRFDQLDYLEWAFGTMGLQDKAKHLATLYLEDLSDFIKECVDTDFGVSRYAEQLGQSANSFDALHQRLQDESSYVEAISIRILEEKIQQHQPKLICFSVPFPGNLTSALKCAQHVKHTHYDITISMGGGFPNTELRSLNDPRVFNFIDFICLDDGELPIELLLTEVVNKIPNENNTPILKRTFHLDQGTVFYNNLSLRKDYAQHALGTPDYSDLDLKKNLSVIEIANPMHSLWNDGRWLKLTMAHGCYWGKCTFCDISLDYIKNYEPIAAKLLVDRMEAMMLQTGENGFHFVDEAAPPALMRSLALEIIQRNLVVTWWTNIRFEKSFTFDLCRLLQASGCVAISGGLEVASNRLLKLIDKGVTVEQVAQVTNNFTQAGILVHAYLMYGYPTQTEQETIDSLEMVRQLFELDVLKSGFWHQFSLTAHSPIGLNPEKFGVIPQLKKIQFANNDIDFKDVTGINHDKFRDGLNKSLYNFMHGICFEYPLQQWFDFEIPETSISKTYILDAVEGTEVKSLKNNLKVIFIGTEPIVKRPKKGQMLQLTFYDKNGGIEIALPVDLAEWLLNVLDDCSIQNTTLRNLGEVRLQFENEIGDFDQFIDSEEFEVLRELGLLIL